MPRRKPEAMPWRCAPPPLIRQLELALTVTGSSDQRIAARVDVRDLLASVLRNDPITMWYELLVQRQLGDGYLDTATVPAVPARSQAR